VSGIVVGGDGNLYVSDVLNSVIRQVTPAGVRSRWSRARPLPIGTAPGGLPAKINSPTGMALLSTAARCRWPWSIPSSTPSCASIYPRNKSHMPHPVHLMPPAHVFHSVRDWPCHRRRWPAPRTRCAAETPAAPAQNAASTTWLRCGALWDGRSGKTQGPSLIEVRGTQIVSVRPAGAAAPDGKVIDLSQLTCLPGLDRQPYACAAAR
jgi:hypothetical protein